MERVGDVCRQPAEIAKTFAQPLFLVWIKAEDERRERIRVVRDPRRRVVSGKEVKQVRALCRSSEDEQEGEDIPDIFFGRSSQIELRWRRGEASRDVDDVPPAVPSRRSEL